MDIPIKSSSITGLNGPERVVSGWRPKIKSKPNAPVTITCEGSPFPPTPATSRQASIKTVPNTNTHNGRTISLSNPLDRLCELLLPWPIIDDIVRQSRDHDFPGNRDVNDTDNSSLVLPDTFTDCMQYVEMWEPLVIDEIKASVLSSLPQNTRDPQRRGTVDVACLEDSRNSSLVRLECAFTDSRQDVSSSESYSSHARRKGVDGPAAMDLVLLSLDPIHQPLTASNMSKLSKMKSTLALITSNIRADGSRGVQLKVPRDNWERIQLALQSRDRTDGGAALDLARGDKGVSINSHTPSSSEEVVVQDLSKSGNNSNTRRPVTNAYPDKNRVVERSTVITVDPKIHSSGASQDKNKR
jgi:hypothetical protein